MNAFTIFPAIDLRQGRVVRLRQGDPAQETHYGDDPLAATRRWQAAGATWLHVVNLDGALDESGRANMAALEKILTSGLSIQFGGGMRELDSLRRALELGVSRAVIGTAAVENPALIEAALAAFGPERIAVGIDAQAGIVRTHGWKEAAGVTAIELGRQWADKGVRWVIFTDIARDGASSGVNVTATASLARQTSLSVIASGGVVSLEDVRRVRQAGLAGVIIGRALYEGQIRLEDALAVGTDL
ncbi:MAG: 1-(5-phosphoribosyl)-5-[(5-phosphoribosylamino)methylideneamino]imidazole-4-carboxamide isomerase [Thermoflexales bacterium]|nr:1-(5-phosphoribosyl)-5-[(5-phosphoribosylamino)methylideneamino]imidazole-4-carboxamide isomerase [Thermoflexales bacterium]